ncbi:MAG: cysteine--tRNA ligase [Chloroflexales bacterium]|nr:cysteine--tRNA ligase [Chloroflexales bacterium]
MAIRLYNTMSRNTDELRPVNPGLVRMYVCGVTVYDRAHIGHAMSAIVFDVLRRYLEFRNLQVMHVVNFTDVDDKIIARAHLLGRDPVELASSYVTEFLDDLASLYILPATIYPRVTQSMPQIINFIEQLIAKGFAYPAEGDVYFRVSKDADYGRLSGRSLTDMVSGTRFDVDVRKEHPGDFALWKGAKPGEPAWPSPWGQGRPGWHIECSAMSLDHLGEEIDIHGGGNDLVFPHHENEIAQSESLTGKTFARHWIHNGMLQIQTKLEDGTFKLEKMSKSLGNVVTIREFLNDHAADALRLVVLSSYYRNPLAYGIDIVADQERKLDRIKGGLEPATGKLTDGEAVERLRNATALARPAFVTAMDDDLNTSVALATIFELVRSINVARDAGVAGEVFGAAQTELRDLCGVLGLTLADGPNNVAEAAPFIELLIELRAELRKAKQYQLSDLVRNRLSDLGVTLEDNAQGTRWKA